MAGNVPPSSNTVTNAEMVIDKPRTLPVFSQYTMEASREQLAKTHQLVTFKNTAAEQTHVVLDRFKHAHHLQPGQVQEIDMAVDEVDTYHHWARTDRGIYTTGPRHKIGQPLPPHPVVILELGPVSHTQHAERPMAPQEPDMKALYADLEAREAKLAEREVALNEKIALSSSSGQPNKKGEK